MAFNCGKELKQTYLGTRCAKSAQKDPSLLVALNAESSFCKATVQTAAPPPCHPIQALFKFNQPRQQLEPTLLILCALSGLILESFQMQNASSQIPTIIIITRGKLTIQNKPVERKY